VKYRPILRLEKISVYGENPKEGNDAGTEIKWHSLVAIDWGNRR
jgi:hypothetical protein